MRHLVMIAAGLAAAIVGGAAFARTLAEGSDTIPATYPSAMSHYRSMLTPAQRAMPWLDRFQGVTAPIHEVEIGDQTMLLGWSCKPHDCGDNQVAVLFARDGSRVVARTLIGGEANEAFVGEPTAREQACLRASHDTDENDRC